MCDMDEKLPTARWSLNISSPTVLGPPPKWEDRPPLPHPRMVEVYANTAKLELIRILSRRIEFSMCKFILHYILGLPEYISRSPLIKIFGERVGRWCGYHGRLELKHIADKHGWELELSVALDSALKRKMKKKAARKKKERQDSRHKTSSKAEHMGKAAH